MFKLNKINVNNEECELQSENKSLIKIKITKSQGEQDYTSSHLELSIALCIFEQVEEEPGTLGRPAALASLPLLGLINTSIWITM